MECIELTLNISDERPPHVDACVASANAETGQGDEMWRHLWRDPMQKEHLQEINNLVQALQPCRNLLILGIGGSALGTRALHAALCVNGSPTLFVLDNIDPHTFRRSIEKIKLNDPSLSQTVVTVISKSGETAEIAALYMAVQKAIPQATYVAITGQQGTLRAYAESSGWSIFTVPDGVGGRFSILSPVGLFPAAMCGIDIKGLLEGARAMDDQCMQTQHNPAADRRYVSNSNILGQETANTGPF
jgi:glucose-6-phosphate isomerase